MSESTIRTAIYNAVNGVSNVGLVYSYERWANDWGAFLDLFKTTVGATVQLRGWEVGYRGFVPNTEARVLSGYYVRTHNFIVMGYLGLDDSAATEKTMSALAESVANALESDATLDGIAYDNVETSLLFEPRMFGGALCHYAEIAVTVGEYL